MSVDPAAVRGLHPAERQRLERFAAVFERIDASAYATLSESLATDAEQAQVEALRLIGSGPRKDAVRAAVRAFTDRATQAYGDRFVVQQLLLARSSLPDRPEDRMRFLGSVERVVVALILWDELGEQDRDALVGPWAGLVQPIVEE